LSNEVKSSEKREMPDLPCCSEGYWAPTGSRLPEGEEIGRERKEWFGHGVWKERKNLGEGELNYMETGQRRGKRAPGLEKS